MTILEQGIKRYVCDHAVALQALVWNLMNGQYVLYAIFLVAWTTSEMVAWVDTWGKSVGISGLGNLTQDALDS